MGDLDVSLIREFEARPAFYDRNDPYYKDKIFCENAWDEIANALGYDVPLLKDRMLQLRNRYNLEKRRLEAMNLENPHKQMTSPWPLYNHLCFLSTHIRSRRSYKSMMTRATHMDMMYSNSNSHNGSPGDLTHMKPDFYEALPDHFEGFEDVHVKEEKMDDCDKSQGDQSVQNTTTKHDEARRMPFLQPQTTIHTPETSLKKNLPPQPTYSAPRYYGPPPAKRQRFEGRSEKFEAFGKFLSTSLCDLPESKALELVQKFTNDLVKAFLIPGTNKASPEKKVPMVTIQNLNSGNATVKAAQNGQGNGFEESTDDDDEDDMDDDVQIM